MTVTYVLGRPRAATARGGDCRARDITQARNVFGPHRFAATTDCRISNGLLRVDVGASGAAPALTISAWRPPVVVGDTLSDTLSDTLEGSMSTAAWTAMGVVTIDSTALTALLTSVRIVRISPAAVTLRLLAPVMADAFITLRRGERLVRIQHGSNRPPFVTTTRRVRWTASPSPVGVAYTSRVQEDSPAVGGFPRFLAALGPVTVSAANFSLTTTTSVRTADFGAGVALDATAEQPADHHSQLYDVSRSRLVVA